MYAYELFTQKINNIEHKECLQLLLYTKLGNDQFAKLLNVLIQYYYKNDNNIDLSKVLIKKDTNQTIQICNTYQNQKRKVIKNKKKVISFMGHLFGIHYKSKCIKLDENDWDKFEKWIAAFDKIWFTQKNIHKVIYKIGQIDYPKLLLLPNHNIINSISNNQNNLILKISSHLYFNGVEGKFVQDCSNLSWDKFIGFIDPIYIIPKGKGKLDNQKNQKQIESEFLFHNILNGKSKLSEFKSTSQMMEVIEDQSNTQNSQTIAYTDEFTITLNLAKSLFDAGWLNQILVDYLISKYYKEQQSINQREGKYQIYIMDTRYAQDIFSSQITRTDQINLEQANQIVNTLQFNVNKSMRLIILLNVDRCHFICVCIEEDTIYILNSMNSERSDNYVGQQINKLYSLIKEKQLKSQPDIIQQQVSQQQQQAKIQILKIPQQKNGYDCSIYTLFNSMQLIKHSDIKITEINFEVSPSQISELRIQFFQDLINNNALLSNQKRWYVNER